MVVLFCNIILIFILVIFLVLVCSVRVKIMNLEIKNYDALNDIIKEAIKKEYADALNYIDFIAKVQVCLFEKIPIISITITNMKLKNMLHKLIAKQMAKEVKLRKKLYKKIYKDDLNEKNNKVNKDAENKLQVENEMLQNMNINQDARIEEYVKLKKDFEKAKQSELVEKILDKIKVEEWKLNLNLGTENAAFTAILVAIINMVISIILPLLIPIADGEKFRYQVTPIYLSKHAFELKTSMDISIPII